MVEELTEAHLDKDDLAVIERPLPSQPSFALLSEARDYCLVLLARLAAIRAGSKPFPPECYPYETETGEVIEGPYGGALAYRAPEYFNRAVARLAEIDTHLTALGHDPERCGWGI